MVTTYPTAVTGTIDASSPTLTRDAYETPGARMIFALTRLANAGRLSVYQGTVPAKTIARRRAANKAARAARRAGR